MHKFLMLPALVLINSLVYAAPCEDLAKLALPSTTIIMARTVAAGQFTVPPGSGGQVPDFRDLPTFCRVAATLKPSANSDIKIEVWLPLSGWNGKFQGVGNGGYAGAITPGPLANALRRGYAAAQTDTGHAGDGRDASFALGHREKLIDFGHRSAHEMTVAAKAVVKAFYDMTATRNFLIGSAARLAAGRRWRKRKYTRMTMTASSPAHPETIRPSLLCTRSRLLRRRTKMKPAIFRHRCTPSFIRRCSQAAMDSIALETECWKIRKAASSIRRFCCARTVQIAPPV